MGNRTSLGNEQYAVNKYIGTAYDHVKNVSENIEDVKIVADALGDDFPEDGLDTIVENVGDINTVVDNMDDVNTVAGNILEVVEVADNIDAVLDASNQAELARKWAQEAEDVEVLPNEYSAYHYSKKSEEQAVIATDAADSIGRYQGLWPDTGGSALKGDTYQTQVSGTPTGQYFTALQNTTVDPVGDDANWKVDVTGSYVNQSQEELINGKIFPENGTVKNGDTVPEGTTHLRVLVSGESTIVAMSPVASGVVSLLTETDANVGGTLVTLHVFSNGGYQATDAQLQNITPRIGEQWFNTDDNSTRIGDGVTIGGRKVFNNYDFNGQFLLNKTNNTKTDQELFDEIQADANQGNIVKIMDGEFSGNFETSKTPLMGIGASSVLTTPNANPTLTLKRHTPDWDYYKVSSITVNGGESNARCISFDPNDPFAGRWLLDNVMMRDGSRGVAKPRGNIGDIIKNCTFINLDYGYRALGDAANPMHGGSTTMLQSHMDNINVACYMSEDSVDGGGGYVIKDTIFEQCPGFGVYLDFTGVGAPYTPPSANNLWLEAVATAPSVNLDGNAVAPREFYLKDVNPYIVRDTFFKNIELINSTMIAEKCRIDDSFGSGFSLNVDDDSVLICDDLYANGQIGGVPFVRSILRQIDTSGTRNLGVRGPLKNSQIPLANVGNATNIASNSYSGAGPWVFNGTFNTNATSVSDGVLNDTCAELVVKNNFTLYGESIGTPTVGKWAVWSIHAKQVSGNGFSVATIGFNWKCGDIYLKQGQWVRSYGIQKVGSDASSCRLQFINTSGGNSTIRLADFYLVEFDTYDEAIEFCNSRTSIKNEI